jgi:hypothetical protein
MAALIFKFGHQVIESYRRLAYTPWHALAEFIDNSTQSYQNHKKELDKIFAQNKEQLYVRIAYGKEDGGLIRVVDNAWGMSFDELEAALEVARPPDNTAGRSRYGLGMKTASCWLGDHWSIRTKRYGETVEHYVEIDVPEIAKGKVALAYKAKAGRKDREHYTIIEIRNLHHSFHGRTLGKIKDFLRSMYRHDLTSNSLELEFRGEKLEWDNLDGKLLSLTDGTRYRKDFNFEVDGKKVHGWVGILAKGSRENAGFSILQSDRVIKGWPNSWRPSTLYGQLQGSNDLVNQRLVGEIHLNGFLVSHTKDDILWQGTQEEDVEAELLKACGDYRTIALRRRSTRDDERGPSEHETALAIDELKRELESPEMIDQIELAPVPVKEIVAAAKAKITSDTIQEEATFAAEIAGINILIYLRQDMSPNDSYVYVEASKDDLVLVIINRAHPHWTQLGNSQDVLNYLRHCTYDGLAEWKAQKQASTIDPDTIRILKDGFLRIPMKIEEHQVKDAAAE